MSEELNALKAKAQAKLGEVEQQFTQATQQEAQLVEQLEQTRNLKQQLIGRAAALKEVVDEQPPEEPAPEPEVEPAAEEPVD